VKQFLLSRAVLHRTWSHTADRTDTRNVVRAIQAKAPLDSGTGTIVVDGATGNSRVVDAVDAVATVAVAVAGDVVGVSPGNCDSIHSLKYATSM